MSAQLIKPASSRSFSRAKREICSMAFGPYVKSCYEILQRLADGPHPARFWHSKSSGQV